MIKKRLFSVIAALYVVLGAWKGYVALFDQGAAEPPVYSSLISQWGSHSCRGFFLLRLKNRSSAIKGTSVNHGAGRVETAKFCRHRMTIRVSL